MEPQKPLETKPDLPPAEPDTTVEPTPSVEPNNNDSTEPFAKPKKLPKKLIIIIIVAILVLAGAATIYYLMSTNSTNDQSTASTASTANEQTPASDTAINPDVQAAVDSLTSGVASESTVTETDDSGITSDANTSAGKVGDSINENNL